MAVIYHIPLEYHRVAYYLASQHGPEVSIKHRVSHVEVVVRGPVSRWLSTWLECHSYAKEVIEA